MRKIIVFVLGCLMLILSLGCNSGIGSTQKMSMGGDSMAPTFTNGEKITVDSRAYGSSQPQRGDIIAYKDESGVVMIKRVIGLPGEQIEIKDGKVYVNGNEITENYLNKQNSTEASGTSIWKIPDKNVFVMGDNRQSSKDSRVSGSIPYDRILGKVMK
ncbi:MAG: signal peptidase I [Syntrophomonas sp.]